MIVKAHCCFFFFPVLVSTERTLKRKYRAPKEAESVEDKGEGILYCVYVYNVQPGININYATGDSSASGTNQATQAVTQAASQQTSTESYILNTNTKKFHRPSCSSVKQMKESNKKSSSESRDALIAVGYDPCKKCNP